MPSAAPTPQSDAVLTRRQALTRSQASTGTPPATARHADAHADLPLDPFDAAVRLFSFAPTQPAEPKPEPNPPSFRAVVPVR